MRTEFSPVQLADPAMASSEAVIRKCVHCGFCTATCPTYVLLGDELDSPRGRIYLMKEMLEGEHEPTAEVVKHIDRCLSCLACMTTCPSGVNYMHLVDHARAYIEARYRRPLVERLWRSLLGAVLPHPHRFRLALRLARLARPLGGMFARSKALQPLAAMLALAPSVSPSAIHLPRFTVEDLAREDAPPRAGELSAKPTEGASAPRGRVALMRGCVEPVLRPDFQAAAARLLARLGYEIVPVPGEGCCGALTHHMGRKADSLAAARRNVDAWTFRIQDGDLDAILVTASGCGTTIKDYGFMLRDDPAYAAKAARVSELTRDISEFLAGCGLPPGDGRGLTVAYHAACSLQHGQKVIDAPRTLLEQAGYTVRTPVEAHLCCGSAGVYNILQPTIAGQLGARKAASLDRLKADVIATGNVGCASQIAQYNPTPIVHTVELLDWATGGPAPAGLAVASRPAHT